MQRKHLLFFSNNVKWDAIESIKCEQIVCDDVKLSVPYNRLEELGFNILAISLVERKQPACG